MTIPTIEKVPRPRSAGYNLRIDDYLFRLVITEQSPLDIDDSESQPPQISTESNPEDFSASTGRIYSRSDFRGGEGLAFAHRKSNTDLDNTRYWDSECIDIANQVAGVIPSIKLSPSVDADTSFLNAPHLANVHGRLYITEGSAVVKYTDDPFATPLVWTSEDPDTGEVIADQIQDIEELNDEIYIAYFTHGVHKRDTAGTWTHFSDQGAFELIAAKSRLFGYQDDDLYEIKAGATSDLLASCQTNHLWTGLTSTDNAIVACSTDGFVYIFGFATDEETFDLKLMARSEFPGEQLLEIKAFHNTILLSTIEINQNGAYISRLYKGILNETLAVQWEVLKQWNDEATPAGELTRVEKIITSRDSFYFPLNEVGRGLMSVWRYNLADSGLSRYLCERTDKNSITPVDITILNHRIFASFSHPSSLEQTLVRQQDTFESSGYVILPLADFFTADPKAWTELKLDHVRCSATETITIYFSTNPEAILDPDHTSWSLLATISDGQLDKVRIANTTSRYLTLKIVLETSDGLSSPELYSAAILAYRGGQDVILRIPVNVSDVVRLPNRHTIRARGLGRQVMQILQSLRGRSVDVEIYNPSKRVLGVVERITERQTLQYDRGFLGSISYVTIRGQYLSQSGVVTGESVMGIGMLGIEIMGGVDD